MSQIDNLSAIVNEISQQDQSPQQRKSLLEQKYITLSQRKMITETLLKEIKEELKGLEKEIAVCIKEMGLPLYQILFPEEEKNHD